MGRNIGITLGVLFTTWIFIQIISGVFSFVDSTIAWISSNLFLIVFVGFVVIYLYSSNKY